MASQSFAFEGGEILTGMGASWFVSYAYYKTVDPSHRNWAKVSTTQTRISKYNKGKQYHKAWLKEVQAMNPANLNKTLSGLMQLRPKLWRKLSWKSSANQLTTPTDGGSPKKNSRCLSFSNLQRRNDDETEFNQ